MEFDVVANLMLMVAVVGRNSAYLIVAGIFVLFIGGLLLVCWKSRPPGKLGDTSLDALKKRDTILEAVTFAAEKFLEKPEWESGVPVVLERLGLAVCADRVAVFAADYDGPQAQNTIAIQRFEWNAPGIGSVANTNIEGGEPYLEFELGSWAELLGADERITGFVNDFPEKQRDLLVGRGVKSILVIPIFVGAQWWGFISYEDCNRERKWAAAEIDALETAARILGVAIHNEQVTQELEWAYHQEINIGLEIQNRLLVGKPPKDIIGAKIAAISIPSQQIDGDFYDFVKYDSEHFDLMLGDVMGKGVSAALLGAATKTQLLRAIGNLVCSTNLATLPTPEEIMDFIHEEMCEKLMTLNSFATLCLARFALDKNRMDLVDAGHTKTIHYKTRTGTCNLLKSQNLPLGFDLNEKYEQISVHFEPGDILLFYSDGLVETANANGDRFGTDRVAQFVQTHASLEPSELIKELYGELVRFAASVTFSDDLTYVAVKIEPPSHNKILKRERKQISSKLSELSTARSFLENVLAGIPQLDVRFLSMLELATSEATSNIIKHAYQDDTKKFIDIEVTVYDDKIVVCLYHWGTPLKKFQMMTPAFDGSQESGFGLYFIRNCVDEVHYSTDDEGLTCVRLVKQIKKGAPPTGSGAI